MTTPDATGPNTDPVLREQLITQVRGARNRFRRGAAIWATAYHTSLIGAAVLSATAALVLKLPDPPLNNLATVCASLAALLATLNILGGFEGKWHANRNAFYDLDALLIDADDPETSTRDIRNGLKRTMRNQRVSWIAPPRQTDQTTDK
ncbi:hypothetical protein ACQP1G_33370 [Nocardia sp. CA-107356]|uniref:hypothetical protein n=1 Tax=Nocardia sp. CA-107356 TaxID=3239972 RepID=UPI003D8DE97B